MQITTGTPLADFASQLKHAVVASVKAVGVETPYAYALVLGQVGNWLGYAVATEEGLRRVAQRYHDLGYRYADDECDEAEMEQPGRRVVHQRLPRELGHSGNPGEAC